jgi:hypothetical protein
MATVTHRKIISYRWICTDKPRCEAIDELIGELSQHESSLSSYVASGQISGLTCVTLTNKFTYMLKDLRNERKTLWRRVRHEVEEEIVSDDSEAVAEGYTHE